MPLDAPVISTILFVKSLMVGLLSMIAIVGSQGDEALDRCAGILARSSRRCGLALWAGEARAIFNGMEILADIAASIARHTPRAGFPATPPQRLPPVPSSTPTTPQPNHTR